MSTRGADLRTAAFPQVRSCPTGGFGEENFLDWLKLPNVASVGGSWLAPAADIRAGNWSALTARARRAVEQVRQLQVGVNAPPHLLRGMS